MLFLCFVVWIGALILETQERFLFIFFYLWIKEAWACFLRLGSALAGVKSQINRSSNELPGASKSLRLRRPPLCCPVMDGCEHHSHISKKNGSDAIPVKEKHPPWWCIVVVWCSLLYLCLSSVPNCHRCLLLFGLPTATRTLNMLSWSYLKELCFFWSVESACFDTIRAFVVTAHTWKCEWRHKAARCCVTPSLLPLI